MRRYRVMRAVENPMSVLIDLDFEALEPAQAFAARLQDLRARVERIRDPHARIVEQVDERLARSSSGGG